MERRPRQPETEWCRQYLTNHTSVNDALSFPKGEEKGGLKGLPLSDEGRSQQLHTGSDAEEAEEGKGTKNK